MMKELQKLIDELMVDKENANERFLNAARRCYQRGKDYNEGQLLAFSLCIKKVELLLKSAHDSNHEAIAHCANTALGESAASNEGNEVEAPAGNSISETGIVRQNEGAEEVCQCGNVELTYNEDGFERCDLCEKVVGKPVDPARREG